MSKTIIYSSIAFTLLYLVGSIHYIKICESENSKVKTALEERSKILDYSDRLLNLQEWLTEVEYQKKKEKVNKLELLAAEHQNIANENSFVLLLVSFVYFNILLFLFGKKHRIFALFLSTAIIGISFLIQGIFNPMLKIEAFKTDLTVKAQITPINTPEYNRGKELLDSMDHSLTLKLDSLLSSVNKKLDDVDSKMNELKADLNSSAEMVKIIPMVGESSAEKLKELSIKLPVSKPLIEPYVTLMRDQLVEIKKYLEIH